MHTVEDLKEYKKNANKILTQNSQYATAKVVEELFEKAIYEEQLVDRLNEVLNRL